MTDSRSPIAGFAPTRWSLVARARGTTAEARTALSELCEAYWRPVFETLRRWHGTDDEARESAQEFFAHVLAGGRLAGADPARGRFRSYLLGALRHFESDLRERACRLKRGGGVAIASLSEDEIAEPASPSLDPIRFDREWAFTVVDRALMAVETDLRMAGRSAHFERLKPALVGDDLPSPSDLARELGLTEGALKVAIHRLRRRFREAVRAEIGQTLSEGDDVQEELRYLIEVLASTGG
ncbi:MAG: sigma-70 family RNA polymerase sigma factor [Verrucomicrobia bacterium]|nr:sigma-70 family RNA polymerase sigma factor [Verrucomicrobiota bacterium]